MIIYLAATIARRSRATYPEASDGPPSNASLFGLAPCGVCRASDVTTRAVRSYRTISPLPPPKEEAVYFLWHFPSRHRDWGLPSTLPWGVRTFLRPEGRRSSGRLEQARPLYGTRQFGVSFRGSRWFFIERSRASVTAGADRGKAGRLPRLGTAWPRLDAPPTGLGVARGTCRLARGSVR